LEEGWGEKESKVLIEKNKPLTLILSPEGRGKAIPNLLEGEGRVRGNQRDYKKLKRHLYLHIRFIS
jgi:hypothetical protein